MLSKNVVRHILAKDNHFSAALVICEASSAPHTPPCPLHAN